MEADDHESIEQCLCDDGKDPATAKMGHAYMQGIATVYRIEKAWQDKFGQSMKLSDLGFDNFPGGDYQTLFRATVDAGADLEVAFQNDEARIRVPVPPEKFTGTGPDRDTADARWSGAMLVFNRIDGDWKLNTDRTFNFGVHASRMPGNKTDVMEILANVSQGLNDTLDDIASQDRIRQNRATKVAGGLRRPETRVGKVFRDNKVNGCNFMTLPVIGGDA